MMRTPKAIEELQIILSKKCLLSPGCVADRMYSKGLRKPTIKDRKYFGIQSYHLVLQESLFHFYLEASDGHVRMHGPPAPVPLGANLFFICFPMAAAAPYHSPSKIDTDKGQLEKRYTSPTVIWPANLTRTPLNVFCQILETQPNPDPDLIKDCVALDATYVSLTVDNPDLHQIMPWAGTRYKVGSQAFLDTFTRVGLWWTRGPFSIDVIFADGGNCTAWG